MRYHAFQISHYRAIEGPMRIDISKESLVPVIGVNECGKTTILHAIFAFDYNNDSLNGGKQLQDTANLYSVDPKTPKITAEIDITFDEFLLILGAIDKKDQTIDKSAIGSYKRLRKQFPSPLQITRNLFEKTYALEGSQFYHPALNALIAEKIIGKLPYTLFFDDFRDSIDEQIEIKEEEDDSDSGWLAIIQTLFEQTDDSFLVHDLPKKEERQRKAILSKVNQKLNNTLTREWQNFRLDNNSDALKIAIEYKEVQISPDSKRAYLKFEVIERDRAGDEHYFFVRDRSKGFFWFFNFVMKLEFNPKVIANTDVDAIYLLDEPGSYLHAAAQAKLCTKLKNLANRNKVIYCTHSHHLLNPEVIPINLIRIAEKNEYGKVSLVPIHNHKGNIVERRSAYQPVFDALQIRPLNVEFGHQATILVEGIIDYYLLDIFNQNDSLTIVPCVGADSIKFYISFMIAWRINYCALWDNDPAGKKALQDATRHFGQLESQTRFRLLPIPKGRRKRIIQDLIDSSDLALIRSRLSLSPLTSLQKTIAGWYYSSDRKIIYSEISDRTKKNFAELFIILPAR